MKTSKDEQNKKYSRILNPIRSICLTLCLTLIIGICPVYATSFQYVNVEVPGNLWSYIVNSDGTIDVSSSNALDSTFNGQHLTWYLGRLSQTISRIANFTYQNGTYLATLYTYLTTTLNNIATSSYNTALSVNSLMTSSMNIDWAAESITYGYYGSLSNAINQTNTLSQGAYPDIYVRVEFSNEIFGKAVKMIFPVIPYNTMDLNNADYYIKEVYTPTNNGLGGTLVSTTKQRLYFADQYHTSMFYFDGSGFTMSNGNYRKILIFHITGDHNSYIYATRNTEAYSLSNNSEDYYKLANYINLNNLSTDDVVRALQDLEVNVEVNDSINVTPIDLDVSIGIEDFTAVNTVSNKLRTWLTTGVSVSALIGALDTLDDSFFTLPNRNTIETINSQYTDFYD